jgi:hypothetical protein
LLQEEARGENGEGVGYKDKYHPSSGVVEPRVQMPRAKASVRTVPAWESERLQEVLLAE